MCYNFVMNKKSPIHSLFVAPVIGLALFSINPSQAADVFAEVNGNWNSDIWTSPTSGGAIIPGLRPDEEDLARIQGIRAVTVDSDVGTVNGLNLQGTNAVASLTLNDGAVLEVLGSVGFNNPNGTRTLTLNAGSALIVGGILNQANGANTSVTNVNTGATLTIAGLRAAQTGTGTLNIAGGTVNVTGAGSNSASITGGAAGNGTITISSGGQYISDIGLTMANNATGTGTINLQSGTMTIRGTLNRGNGTGNLNWTGGTLSVQDTNLATINNTGTGTFAPGEVGAVGSFSVSAGTVTYNQGVNAFLNLDFASDASFDTISIGAGTALNMNLAGTLTLNLLADYIPTDGMTFDVITATTIVNNGYILAGNGASKFTSEIVTVGSNQVLRLTAIPEPSAFGLILAGVLGVIVLHKRRRAVSQ